MANTDKAVDHLNAKTRG